MQSLQDIANFNAGGTGNFGPGSTRRRANFLSGEIAQCPQCHSVDQLSRAVQWRNLSAVAGRSHQSASSDHRLYGLRSDIQDTNMATASASLSLNQTALQADFAGHLHAERNFSAELSPARQTTGEARLPACSAGPIRPRHESLDVSAFPNRLAPARRRRHVGRRRFLRHRRAAEARRATTWSA